jgi:hypothetical protein
MIARLRDVPTETSMIELTEPQQKALKGNGEPLRVLDPTTSTEYVLVRADVYSHLQQFPEQAEDKAEQAAWADAVEEARMKMNDD